MRLIFFKEIIYIKVLIKRFYQYTSILSIKSIYKQEEYDKYNKTIRNHNQMNNLFCFAMRVQNKTAYINYTFWIRTIVDPQLTYLFIAHF